MKPLVLVVLLAPISAVARTIDFESTDIGKVPAGWSVAIPNPIHPAPAGVAEEHVNDAFDEYYVSDAVTVRGGQSVKPFGFDIQHSSSARESPERGIFAGYFFPGQRDRGL